MNCSKEGCAIYVAGVRRCAICCVENEMSLCSGEFCSCLPTTTQNHDYGVFLFIVFILLLCAIILWVALSRRRNVGESEPVVLEHIAVAGPVE